MSKHLSNLCFPYLGRQFFYLFNNYYVFLHTNRNKKHNLLIDIIPNCKNGSQII